jgi:uncharacterized OB-fold protein
MGEEAATVEAPARPRRAGEGKASGEAAPTPPAPAPAPRERRPSVPTLLDFYPLEDARFTELSAFFEHLKQGRFTTTRCRRDGRLLWPPRTACPHCHGAELDWVDLPTRGRIYAFSAVLAGAPLGMEADVPFAVGLVDLDGVPLRLFGRIAGRPWGELTIGDAVRVEPLTLDDGRIFYRFHVEPSAPAR